MDGLDVKLEQTHDHVHDQENCVLTFKTVFSHENARNVMYNTNFILEITPRIKQTIDALFEEYTARLETTPPPPPTNTTVAAARFEHQLGSSRRVVHLEHFAGKVCSVCQSNYVLNEFVRTLPICKHIFHKRCIDPWIKRNQKPTCPVCREQIIHTSSERNESPAHAHRDTERSLLAPDVSAGGPTPSPSSTEGVPEDSN